jgi:hypothetical protein
LDEWPSGAKSGISLCLKLFEEEPSRVAENLRFDDDDIRNVGIDDVHGLKFALAGLTE